MADTDRFHLSRSTELPLPHSDVPRQLFEEEFYLSQLADKASVGDSAFAHYVSVGWKLYLDPHPLFSTSYYLSQVESLAGGDLDPLRHYVLIGDREGVLPHPLFDPRYYRQQAQFGNEPSLAHYLRIGHRTANPHPLFDGSYYRSRVQAQRGAIPLTLNPLVDFILQGNDEGIDPHPLFHTIFYYLQRPDVANANVTALDHYLRFGWSEGARPHPLIDFAYYQHSNGEQPSGNPLLHFLQRPNGHCSTSPIFDLDFYLRQLEVRKMPAPNHHPTLHYLTEGHQLNLSAQPLFDAAFYSKTALSYSAGEGDPLTHYLVYGHREDANPHPYFDTPWYRGRYMGGERSVMSPFEHYLRHWRYSRELAPCWGFDSQHYLHYVPGCIDQNVPPPYHYASYQAVPAFVPNETVQCVSGEHHALIEKYSQACRLTRDESPLRIFLTAHEASRSGAPLIILNILKRLKDRLKAQCFLLLDAGGELEEDFARHATVIRLDKLREQGISNFSLHLSTMIRPGRTIALSNSAECYRSALLLSALGVPTVTLVHEFATLYGQGLIGKLCDASESLVFPSEAVKNDAMQVFGSRHKKLKEAIVLHHGLIHPGILDKVRDECRAEVVDELDLDPDTFIILGSGQIQNRKGIDFFILTAKEFTRRYPLRKVSFLWLGGRSCHEGYLEGWLLDDIERAGLTGKVTFMGVREDPAKYHAAADAFLMLSRFDPFPLVVLEAMAAGTPVITFDEVTGAPEVVRGKGGFVVPFLDINGVVQKLDILYSDPELRSRIEQSAREWIRDNYSFDEYTYQIFRRFEAVIGAAAVDKVKGAAARVPARVERGVRSHTVVFTAPNSSLSGVNVAIDVLVRGLSERGWPVKVALTHQPILNNYFSPTPEYADVLPVSHLAGMFERLACLQNYIYRNGPSIMVLGFDHNVNALASALPDDVGVVGWAHCDSPDYYEEMYRLGRYCNKIVGVSQKIVRSIAELNSSLASRLEAIPATSLTEQDIVTNRTYLGEGGALRLIYTGRLVERQKRVLDFVPLVKALDDASFPYVLTLVGNDCETGTADILRRELASYIQRGVVRILDRVSQQEVKRLLTVHDVFVLLSDYEGLPISVLEAMASGCVPITAPIQSGLPELVEQGVNGLMLPTEDWHVWGATLHSLSLSSKKLEQMGRAAVKTVEHRYLAKEFVERFDRVLLEVEGQLLSRTFVRPPSLLSGSPFGDIVAPQSWLATK